MSFFQWLKESWFNFLRRVEENRGKQLERLDKQIELEKERNKIYKKRKELEELRNQRGVL